MVLFTKVSGSSMKTRKMVEEFKSGLMDLDMMASGEMEWPMATEDSSMLKVMFTRESGLKIKLMAMEFILTLTAAGTKDSGSRINSMDSVLNSGLTEPSTRVSTSKE